MRYILFMLILMLPLVGAQEVCDELTIDITSCTDGDTLLVADMVVPDAYVDDIMYTFNTQRGIITNEQARGVKNAWFDGFDVSGEANIYRITWETDLEVRSVEITHPECTGKNYRVFRADCFQEQQCTTHNDCADNEQCTNAFCEAITCSACQDATNHQCVDRCVATDACTIGACMPDGSCSYTQIESCCRNDDECQDGLTCTINQCDPQTHTCTQKPKECPNLCSEPDGCLILDNYFGNSDDFFTGTVYRIQKKFSENMFSRILFVIALLVIFVLIFLQTKINRRRHMAPRK